MRGAGSITAASGAVPVAAAWIAGASGLPAAYRPITDVLAEVLAALLVVLAWRFRRGRLAVAALLVAAANLLLRGPLAGAEAGAGEPLLELLLPLTIAALALLPERPLARPQTLVLAAVVLIEAWLVLALARGAPARGLLAAPELGRMVFLIAGAFVTLAFAARRGAFEGSLLWVLAAAALAVLGDRGPQAATLACAAAQLVLLVGLVEDSYRLAYHDELTGLPGRRALEEALRSLDGELAVAMVDIDHFKNFNDRHGHAAGDQALRMVAAELAKVGGGGRPYRYGGEEFAVLFPGPAAAAARGALEEVRTAIAGRRFALRAPDRPATRPQTPRPPTRPPQLIGLSVSIGLATTSAGAASPQAALRTADRALYEAKGAGRNRLVAADDRSPRAAG